MLRQLLQVVARAAAVKGAEVEGVEVVREGR